MVLSLFKHCHFHSKWIDKQMLWDQPSPILGKIHCILYFHTFPFEWYYFLQIRLSVLTSPTSDLQNLSKLPTREVFENPNYFLSYKKFNCWVVTNVQNNYYIIGNKYINNRINYLRSISNFLRKMINQFLRNCLWYPTIVTSWVWII